MAKIVVIVVCLIFMLQGQASCQSFLDSVFGAGGLGIWGAPQQTPSFDHPRYYGGGVDPNQQFGPQQQMGSQQGYDQQYPPQQAYGYGQMQPTGPGQGYYPDWQNQPPPGAPMPPYVPGQIQPPPQQPPPQQAQPRPQRSSRPRAATPPQPSQEQMGRFGDPLPAGAARVTTTTPEGTTVHYYPPSGTQEAEQYSEPIQQPRPRAASSRVGRSQQEVAPQQEQAPRSSIAMPKPVTIPQGQDPRSGWRPN